MAVPAYNSSGTGSNVLGSNNPTPAWPATPVSGAIAIMIASVRSDATRTMATPAGWALVNDSGLWGANTNQTTYVFVYGTVADPTALTGTESGTVTVTCSGGTAGRNAAIIHQFTGANVVWHFEDIDFQSKNVADTAFSDNDVTTTGIDRLAINLVNCATTQAGALVIPGNMTGGTWVLRNNYTENHPSLHVVTADMAAAGTVGGGTSTIAVGSSVGICGFALYTTLSPIAPSGSACAPTFGSVPIICPSGRN